MGRWGGGQGETRLRYGSEVHSLTHSLICSGGTPHSASSTRRTSAQLPSHYTFEYQTADWFKWSHAVCVHTPCVVRLKYLFLCSAQMYVHIVTLDCVRDCERGFLNVVVQPEVVSSEGLSRAPRGM